MPKNYAQYSKEAQNPEVAARKFDGRDYEEEDAVAEQFKELLSIFTSKPAFIIYSAFCGLCFLYAMCYAAPIIAKMCDWSIELFH